VTSVSASAKEDIVALVAPPPDLLRIRLAHPLTARRSHTEVVGLTSAIKTRPDSKSGSWCPC
jgi:hypothetical protein